MTNDSKKRATVPGSFNDIENQIRASINTKYNQDPLYSIDLWPNDIIPDEPIKAGSTILHDYKTEKYYKMSFSVNQDGTVTLGESEEVKPFTTYDPVVKGMFVAKDDAKREVTGPVELPGCPDCDFKRGEIIRTEKQVQGFCTDFDDFRIADEMHLLGSTGNIVGTVIKHWTLEQEETYTNIIGEEVTLPIGTWMATTKITDDETWKKVQKGIYKGYSGTYLSRKDAEELKKQISANKSMNPLMAHIEAIKERVLIKDLDDPVPVTISIVDNPCVPNAIFTSVKSCNIQSDKAGRAISNSTLDKIQKVYDGITSGLDTLKDLLTKADDERADPLNQNGTVVDANKKEVEDMDAEELGKIIDDKLTPIKTEIEEVKKKLPEEEPGDPGGNPAIKCNECEHELQEADKFCPACGDAILKEGEKPPEKLEENPVIKGILETQNKISEKLGIPVESHKIKGQEDNTEPAKKSDADFYKEAGCKSNGRPIKE